MGKGIDNRGLPYLSIGFERSRDTDYIVDRLEEAIGFTFDGTASYSVFRDRIDQSLISAATTSDNKHLELLFTLVQGRSWRIARNNPAVYILVQSKAQKALQDQYDKEDAEEAALKKQRTADYDARMEAQKREDAAKLIIRDSNGKELVNVYESQRRGSDYAGRLNASFGVYGRSGFDEKFLGQVIFDYAAVLSSQLHDLKNFNEFLMSESATWLGRFVTFTGGIDRPDLTNTLADSNKLLARAVNEYKDKAGTAPELALDQMGRIEAYCSHASGKLEKFYEASVSHAHRIALALQIVQMAIPVGGSAAFLEALCIEAASKFSYAVTDKIVNGSDRSWSATLADATVGSVRDTIMRSAVTKLVGKIPKIGGISGIKGDAIKIAVTTLTSAVAQNMAGLFQGETFGDALANLYRNLKSPETWLVPLVNHAFGKYLDVSQPAGPAGKGLPEGSGTRMEPVKKPVKIPKKPALAVAVALMFGPAAHTVDLHAKKPTITETQRAGASEAGNPPAPEKRPDYLNRGIGDKGGVGDRGVGSKTTTAGSGKIPQKVNPGDRETSNATAGPAKPVKTPAAPAEGASGQGRRPPTSPPKTPATVPPRIPSKRRRSKPGGPRAGPQGYLSVDVDQSAIVRQLRREGWTVRKSQLIRGKGEAWQRNVTGVDYEWELISPSGVTEVALDGLALESADATQLTILEAKAGYTDIVEASAHFRFSDDKIAQLTRQLGAVLESNGRIGKVVVVCNRRAVAETYANIAAQHIAGDLRTRLPAQARAWLERRAGVPVKRLLQQDLERLVDEHVEIVWSDWASKPR